jgi:hypothetical protein
MSRQKGHEEVADVGVQVQSGMWGAVGHGGSLLNALHVPHCYCWSQSIVPKPHDWGDEIDVVGYFFLKQTQLTEYDPPLELVDFLEAGGQAEKQRDR